jgi:lipoyl(octanoyl) transferase
VSRSSRAAAEPVEVHEIGTVDYQEAWDRQRAHADARVDGGPDVLLLLEHPSVYTAGKRTLPEERPADGTPVIDVDRGGKITWHGPGQLVGYPIIGLAQPFDVVDHVRRLEQALITVCDSYGLATGRIDGRTGVWLPADDRGPARKIAAIGVRVARGVTMHGFALNCDPDMSAFANMIPCGIPDAGATSLSDELGRDVGVPEVIDAVEAAMRGVLTAAPTPA